MSSKEKHVLGELLFRLTQKVQNCVHNEEADHLLLQEAESTEHKNFIFISNILKSNINDLFCNLYVNNFHDLWRT